MLAYRAALMVRDGARPQRQEYPRSVSKGARLLTMRADHRPCRRFSHAPFTLERSRPLAPVAGQAGVRFAPRATGSSYSYRAESVAGFGAGGRGVIWLTAAGAGLAGPATWPPPSLASSSASALEGSTSPQPNSSSRPLGSSLLALDVSFEHGIGVDLRMALDEQGRDAADMGGRNRRSGGELIFLVRCRHHDVNARGRERNVWAAN